MAIQNTKAFQDFIVNQEISDEKEKNIQQMIGAFSEYIAFQNFLKCIMKIPWAQQSVLY